MTEPRTAAGRALLDFLANIRPFLEDEPVLNDASIERIRPQILAIEAEAREEGMLRQLERSIHDEGGKTVSIGQAPDSEALRAALERIEFRAQGQSLSGLRVRPEAALTAIREEARAALILEAK
jgi:hypothetical protein